MGFLTRSIVPYHVRHPARSAVHNADRRRRASNWKASKGFVESAMAWVDKPQPQEVRVDGLAIAKRFEDWYNGEPGRRMEVGSATLLWVIYDVVAPSLRGSVNRY